MAIPKFKKEYIAKALKYIDENGVPFHNQSTKYELVTDDGNWYPPKYVVAVANHLANGVDISTDSYNAVEAKSFLENQGFTIETKQQEKLELFITAESVVSTDERFTMDNIGLGDNYRPLDVCFKKATGEVIKRSYSKGERRNSNQTMPRIACQIFEKQLASLSVEAKESFPVCRYSPDSEMISGIFASVDEYKKHRNTIEYMIYGYDNGRQFVIYCWNIFSTIMFVQECLKRFGEPGDQFILTYREKDEKETVVEEAEAAAQEELVQQFKGYRNPFSSMLIESKNLIFRGAPGTGKSYLAKEIAADIISNGYFDDYTLLTDEQKKQVEFVQFHPSYDYSDFVEGLRPKVNADGTMGFELLRKKTDNPRTLLFLDIAEEVYHHYQTTLKQQNQIDFADMINDAHFYLQEIENQNLTLPYKYIIIDEFQDIARQRFNLTKRLSEITKAKVVAVGDDWQSIYAFSGSDITLFTRFLQLMGAGTELKITHTYRNSQELIDIAGGFVQKNSAQIRKQLISPKHLENPIVIEPFDDSVKPKLALANTVEQIIGKIIEEFGDKKSILLVGRYNYDMYWLCNTDKFSELPGNRVKSEKYPNANITFMTAHSSKGLGYDNVVLINMFEGKFGFPCQIEDDPIIKLVMYEDKSMPFAEERRLFYVAMTRTKNRVYIATPKHKPSRFLVELIKDYKLPLSEEINMQTVDLFNLRCPVCGFPLKYEFNKNYGLNLWICTNEVEVCDFMTNDKIHKHDICKCPKCRDGYLIVRKNVKNGDIFYGCTNYYNDDNKCTNMIRLSSDPV